MAAAPTDPAITARFQFSISSPDQKAFDSRILNHTSMLYTSADTPFDRTIRYSLFVVRYTCRCERRKVNREQRIEEHL
jgi:hypothetical protein